MRPIDLHVHSSCSDGTVSPAGLVEMARAKGLAAFALTDHDTVEGLAEAMQYAAKPGAGQPAQGEGKAGLCPAAPQVIPGIELSTEYHGRDIHVLGLYIDHQDANFLESLKKFVDSRRERNQKMCALLQQAGVSVSYEELLAAYPGAVITRAHYAGYLLDKGFVKSRQEAFDRYVGDHAPCFVPREKITPAQAVALILQAGGVPILAHPPLYHMTKKQLETLLAELKDAGLLGIEAIYSTYAPADERLMRSLASRYGLLISGGSDFHGENKPGLEMGTGRGGLFVPESLLLPIRQAARSAGAV